MRTKYWHDERFIGVEGIGHKAVAEAVTATGATEEVDFDDGLFHALTLDANCTISFANEPDDSTVIVAYIKLTQDGTGSRTVTWPSNVDWAGGSAPTLTTTANAVDLIKLVKYPGDNWIGSSQLDIS